MSLYPGSPAASYYGHIYSRYGDVYGSSLVNRSVTAAPPHHDWFDVAVTAGGSGGGYMTPSLQPTAVSASGVDPYNARGGVTGYEQFAPMFGVTPSRVAGGGATSGLLPNWHRPEDAGFKPETGGLVGGGGLQSIGGGASPSAGSVAECHVIGSTSTAISLHQMSTPQPPSLQFVRSSLHESSCNSSSGDDDIDTRSTSAATQDGGRHSDDVTCGNDDGKETTTGHVFAPGAEHHGTERHCLLWACKTCKNKKVATVDRRKVSAY